MTEGHCYCDDSMGFKGKFPELEPGESFEFTSMAPLTSPNAVFTAAARFKKKMVLKPKRLIFRPFTMTGAAAAVLSFELIKKPLF